MPNRSHPYSQSWQVLLLLLCLGGITGAWIGEIIIRLVPALHFLGVVQSIGLPNFTMDLQVFSLTFGFMLRISFFTIVGLILAFLIFRRL